MRTYFLMVMVIFLVLPAAAVNAAPPATQAATRPPIITGTLGQPKDTAKTAAVLGHNGLRFIRSQARWNDLHKRMPAVTAGEPEDGTRRIDFAKEAVVMIYADNRRPRDKFELLASDLAANPPELTFMLRWDNGPVEEAEARSIKFISAIIPATPAAKVVINSQPTLVDRSRIVTEFSATAGGKNGGDIVDGLQAAIAPKAATIKPGDDILIDFELHLAQMPAARPEQFRPIADTVHVWDGKYSNGYRNHGFFVTTPDGKTTLLRPAEIGEWRKNIPHPVGITAKQPYHLPNWVEGDTHKSLKALGLDTTTAGTYTITGLYEETAGAADASKTALWGGSIASNTVTVEVKK